MSEVIEIRISDITEYISHVIKDVKTSEIRIFRGQQNSEWNIEASVFRGDYHDAKEKDIYETIKKYNFNEFKPKEHFLDELIQMQHYGIPTRLLDWTYNPLIALFFAVSTGDNTDGKIFQKTLNKSTIHKFNSPDFKLLSKLMHRDATESAINLEDDLDLKKFVIDVFLNNKNTYFIDTILENDRIRAQQGCFSLTIDRKDKFLYTISNKVFEFLIQKHIKSLKSDYRIKESLISYKNTDNISKLVIAITNNYTDNNSLVKYKSIIANFINNIPKEKGLELDPIENNIIVDEFARDIINSIEKLKEKVIINENELSKYIIPKEKKNKIKKQLENLGITSTFVYPDIQGSIDYIKDTFR